MAQILKYTKKNLFRCCNQLKDEKLVAFPTETVFGLGGCLKSSLALDKIFDTKKRSQLNPLIIHVLSSHEAQSLCHLNEKQKVIFEILAKNFWPGPLSIVVKKNAKVPKKACAGLDTVALRVPSHPVSQRLLKEYGGPIAAPSANISGHVSPTEASHVFDDFKSKRDLLILDEEEDSKKSRVGLESTIVKLTDDNELHILRLGTILEKDILECFSREKETITLSDKTLLSDNFKSLRTPGSSLKHYAPFKECYILKEDSQEKMLHLKTRSVLNKVAVVDFFATNRFLKDNVFLYEDLSKNGKLDEAYRNFYSVLRTIERNEDVKLILLPSLNSSCQRVLFDRIYRAASGRYVSIDDIV